MNLESSVIEFRNIIDKLNAQLTESLKTINIAINLGKLKTSQIIITQSQSHSFITSTDEAI
jgi:hypothetical protein